MSEEQNEFEQEEKESIEDLMADEAAEKAAEEEVLEDDPKQAEIDSLNAKLAEEKDKYLRVVAEYDNFRKRTVKEKSEAYSDATIRTVTEFLSVIDNFERALNCDCTDDKFKSGVQMIFNQYLDILKKLNVTEIEAKGKEFDPKLHNAVNQIEDENLPENTVSDVFQKGYKLGDKVIRHAMVVVANP